jgi:ATP-dependent Clp protease, protease subunit
MKTWFSIKARAASTAGPAEIYIFDELGAFGIRADRFIEALKALGDVANIALHVNSPGGDPFAAASMYLALKRHPATVTAYNDGLVASAASVVLMAGDRIIAPENTMLMIHDPVGGVFGTADDMREFASAMDKIKQTILTAYRRSGKTDEELSAIMSAETWYTATEAKAAGFVDEISKEIQVAACFDLHKFGRPPAARARFDVDRINDRYRAREGRASYWRA